MTSDQAWSRYAFICKWAPEFVAQKSGIEKAIELAGLLYDALQEAEPK